MASDASQAPSSEEFHKQLYNVMTFSPLRRTLGLVKTIKYELLLKTKKKTCGHKFC